MPRKLTYALAIAGVAAGLTMAATTAHAIVPTPAVPTDTNPCDLAGWYANPDEAHRLPDFTFGGLVFEDSDLIHHAAPEGLTTKALVNGGFSASPNPDQPSFFSVEVFGDDGKYGTLRWDRFKLIWTLTAEQVTYENTDPDKLVDMPPAKRSHKVQTFGVGYTASPANGIKTTVKSVSFQGKAYQLSCPKPTTSPTATPTTTPSSTGSPSTSTSVTPSTTGSPSSTPSSTRTASPSTSASSSATPSKSSTTTAPAPIPADGNPGDPSALPTTGASLGGLLLLGLGILLGGSLLTWWFRKRKRRGINAPY